MRISDWSSDVCSSDLCQHRVSLCQLFGVTDAERTHAGCLDCRHASGSVLDTETRRRRHNDAACRVQENLRVGLAALERAGLGQIVERTAERRDGKGSVMTCRARWYP